MPEEKSIILKNRSISYQLRRRPWSRGLRLSVRFGGQVTVSAPSLMPVSFIERFLRAKSDWIVEKLDYYAKARQIQPQVVFTPEKIKALKKQTLEVITPQLKKYGQILGVNWNKVSVKNITSRWGSCSRNGNLSFNCRMALLPEDLAQYIVVHELCHLRHFDHSKKFWDVVYSVLPDYKTKVKYLRQHVMALS